MENRLPPSASIAELARNSTAILARPSIYASQKESPLRVRAFLERSNDWLSSPAIRSKLSPKSETSLVSAGLSPLAIGESPCFVMYIIPYIYPHWLFRFRHMTGEIGRAAYRERVSTYV